MKYLKQLTIIFGVSLIGEILEWLVPLSIPASVYGLVLMFVLLCTKVVKLSEVEDVADFMLSIMPFFFVAPTVGLMTSWNLIKDSLLWFLIMCFLSTFTVIMVTGLVGQWIIRLRHKKGTENE